MTQTERDIMQTHATLGAQIVQDVLGAEQVLWVLHHHERWDGAGYPRGLTGEEIPEGAQILAVADAWDAMTANRPYRDALEPSVVVDELMKGSGAQWSPRVVEAVIELWNEGKIARSADSTLNENTLPPLDEPPVDPNADPPVGTRFERRTPQRQPVKA